MPSRSLPPLAPSVAIAATGVAMTWWTWGTWPDPFIDFGRELYIAWQLSAGKILYIDVESFNGPLSAHLNGWWFAFFGLGLRTLVVANLFVLALFAALMYSTWRTVTTRLGATVAVVMFLVLFAFGEYDDVGNYNYVTPYAHEIVHGIVLTFVALRSVAWYVRSNRPLAAATAGAALGLVVMTKPEIAVAAGLGCGAGLAAAWWRNTGVNRGASIGACLGGLIAPLFLTALLMSRSMSFTHALSLLIRPFGFLLNRDLSAMPFYARMTGLDDLAASLALLGLAGLVYAVLFGGTWWLSFGDRTKRFAFEIAAGLGFAVFIAGLVAYRGVIDGVARPLPLLMLAAAVVNARQWLTAADDKERGRAVVRLSLALTAGGLLLKVALNAHIQRYGFVLAMPATLFTAVALVDWLPAAIDRRNGSGALFRSVAAVAMATVAIVFIQAHRERIAKNTSTVGTDRDRFLSDSRAAPMNAILHEIKARVSADQTVVVLPEGVMINYLSRRASSTPYPTYLPPEFVMFGASAIRQSLAERPPDYVVLVNRPLREYGAPDFASGYGAEISDWVRVRYDEVAAVAGAPIAGADFGMRLLRRRPDVDATAP